MRVVTCYSAYHEHPMSGLDRVRVDTCYTASHEHLISVIDG